MGIAQQHAVTRPGIIAGPGEGERSHMSVSIKDIAREAGVSPATVSNVLNGKKNVGVETRQRVLAICRELDYEPNPIGKALKSGESRTVLFNFSDFDRQFYLKIIQGISDCVYSRGYDLMICTNRSCGRFMSKSFTSGCIMLDMHCPDELLLKRAGEGYPIVAMDRVLDAPHIKNVVVNNYKPMSELVQGLVERGYRKFAFLGGPDTLDNRERFQAFRDVLRSGGLPFQPGNYLPGDYREKSGGRAARLLLATGGLPEALVCANDDMAAGAMKVFHEAGLRVPGDIAVTGFDGSPVSDTLGLTTVDIPNYERGYLAAQHLLETLQEEGERSTFYIPARVKWRGSSPDRKLLP